MRSLHMNKDAAAPGLALAPVHDVLGPAVCLRLEQAVIVQQK